MLFLLRRPADPFPLFLLTANVKPHVPKAFDNTPITLSDSDDDKKPSAATIRQRARDAALERAEREKRVKKEEILEQQEPVGKKVGKREGGVGKGSVEVIVIDD